MKEFREYLAGLDPEEREKLLEYLRPSKVPFSRPLKTPPDSYEWQTNNTGKDKEGKK